MDECALLYFCDVRVVFSLLFIFMNPVDLLGAKISNNNNNNNNNVENSWTITKSVGRLGTQRTPLGPLGTCCG